MIRAYNRLLQLPAQLLVLPVRPLQLPQVLLVLLVQPLRLHRVPLLQVIQVLQVSPQAWRQVPLVLQLMPVAWQVQPLRLRQVLQVLLVPWMLLIVPVMPPWLQVKVLLTRVQIMAAWPQTPAMVPSLAHLQRVRLPHRSQMTVLIQVLTVQVQAQMDRQRGILLTIL